MSSMLNGRCANLTAAPTQMITHTSQGEAALSRSASSVFLGITVSEKRTLRPSISVSTHVYEVLCHWGKQSHATQYGLGSF